MKKSNLFKIFIYCLLFVFSIFIIPITFSKYTTTLSSMTGGTGDFSYEFARYEEAPKDICDKEVEKAKAMREAENE